MPALFPHQDWTAGHSPHGGTKWGIRPQESLAMQLSLEPESKPAPAVLRVFAPDAAADVFEPDSDQLTLREAFALHLRPSFDLPAQKGTLSAYDTALKHWERFTPNLPIAEACRDNRPWMELRRAMEQKGFAAATIRKTGRHLRALFRRLGPPTDGNPGGLSILQRTPYFEMPRAPKKLPRLATFEELSALYEAASIATWPLLPDIPPSTFWRAVIVCFYNLGPRAWELFCELPHADVNRSDARPGPHWPGWRWGFADLAGREPTLEYWIPKVSAWHRVPLNRIVLAHLASIRGDRRAIFPATLAHGSVYGQWRCLKAAAVATCGDAVKGIEDLDFHNIRKTCQTEWDTLKMGLGDHVVWHTPTDVGGMHYRNFAMLARRRAEDLPQPEAFKSIFEGRAGSRQKRLF